MSVANRPFTYEDLLELPEDDGYRYEIIGGELFVSASPLKKHQWTSFRLSLLLGNYVLANDLGEVYHASVDVRLSPYDIVQPDLIFIRKDRTFIYGDRLVEGAPDLVVEILSPSTKQRDLGPKLALYARAGVREYWVADPEARTLTIHALTDDGGYQRIEPVNGELHSTVLPDLVIDLDFLFM
ncbi:MAG TPA: Uma2 family endonuclease [Thermomicrobiales bacterium]|nr:Uma2 family endonuclease [Thermomicrobiales bacterium]